MTDNSQPSICIPSVSTRITKYDIEKQFRKLNWGSLSAIHINYKNNHNQIFIDFHEWNLIDKHAIDIRNKLMNEETVKIVYDEPWFWKCTANRNSKPKKKITDDDLLQRKRTNQKLQKDKNKIENCFTT